MSTESDLIQRQRELLRQARVANRTRTDAEARATAQHGQAQQQAEETLAAATQQAETAQRQAQAQADADLRKATANAQSVLEQTQNQVAQRRATAADGETQAQKLLGDVALDEPYRPVHAQPAPVELDSRAALQKAADQVAALLRDIQEAVEDLIQQRAEEVRRRRWILAVAAVALILFGWLGFISLRRTLEGRASLSFLAAAYTQAWTNPIDRTPYVHVPAGEFEMGSTTGDNDEQPVHRVYLDEYWIGQTEVTNAQYALCVSAGGCTAPSNSRWQDSDYRDHPVTHVDWNQARAYCAWAGVRLPTEAEWEKAARGTDGRIYPWGNSAPDDRFANYGNIIDGTTPVGNYPEGASPYGALDMAGNVWEWVNDWYDSDYYSQSPSENPQGPATGESRVLRGGSWDNYDSFVRSAFRFKYVPVDWGRYYGFRCVRSQ